MHEKAHMAARTAIIISAMILAATLVIPGCKKEPSNSSGMESPQTPDHNDNNQPSTDPITNNVEEQPINNPDEQPEKPTENKVISKISLKDVISTARNWHPSYDHWYGKTAPDFTLTDFDGKEHKLSDYRGRDVMLVFFATWCGPCLYEIPHLVELRKSIAEDKLAILAISYENPERVKKYVRYYKMNYTVLFEKNNMPNPFGVLRIYGTSGIPCSFFIKPDGKIKLATSGVLRLNDMNAILRAE